jgi:hypothetical protein
MTDRSTWPTRKLRLEDDNDENELARKLKLLRRKKPAVINAPTGYEQELGIACADKLSGEHDWLQIFLKSKSELDHLGRKVVASLEPEGIVWFTFPKGSSKNQTDLTRDNGWGSLEELDLKWVTLVSVNETWSAFAMRPYREGEPRQAWR